eukprot:scaffold37611_cov69-Phaeocystis_antarctica.AAC.9
MAAARSSTSSWLCAAERATRSRAVPLGTVGGLMAGTSKPRLSSCALASSAAPSAPTTMGTMALWGCSPVAAPNVCTRFHSVARSSGVAALSDARAAATAGMGRAVE